MTQQPNPPQRATSPVRRSLRPRFASAIAMTSVAMLALTACGSSSSSGPKADANVKFTGDPITVMTLTPYDTNSLNMKAALTVAQSAATVINNAGGINGHQLKVLTCNEGATDPNLATGCARQAVSAKVSAVIGGFSAFGDAIMPILAAANIPWIAPPGVSLAESTSKDSFMVSSGVYGLAELGALAGDNGCKSTAAVIFDLPTTSTIAGLIDAGLTAHHGPKSTSIKVPPTTTDFSSIAAEISKHDCAILAISSQQVSAIAAAGASLGSHTKYYVVQGALTDSAVKQAGSTLEGTESLSAFALPTDPAFQPVIKAAGDLAGEANGGWSLAWYPTTWVGYQVFAKAMSNATDFSGASVISALNAMSTVDTQGLTAPFGFTQEFPIPGLNRMFNHKVLVTEVKGGKIVAKSPDYVDLMTAFSG